MTDHSIIFSLFVISENASKIIKITEKQRLYLKNVLGIVHN